jgi:leucyl aminopeptidase
MAEARGSSPATQDVVQMAVGARLRLYSFDRYKTKKKDDENGAGTTKLTFAVADPPAARKAARSGEGLAAGVNLARDLVNEPPNVLSPEEFAERTQPLTKLGVEVEVLDVKALRKIGMKALLAVGQGSARDSRVVIMRWNGGKTGESPVAFSARAWCSTPAASRSSRAAAWRT